MFSMIPTYLSFLITLIIIILFYKRESRLVTYPVPSPGLVAAIVLFIYYMIPSFIYAVYPKLSAFKRYYYGYSLEIYNWTSFIGLMAILSLYLGFVVGMGKKERNGFHIVQKFEYMVSRFPNWRLFLATSLIFLFGFGISFYKQKLGWVHYGGVLKVYERSEMPNYLLSLGESFRHIGFIMLTFLFIRGQLKGIWKILLLLFLVLSFLNAIFAGGAGPVIQFSLPFFIYSVYKDYFQKTTDQSIHSRNGKKRRSMFSYGSIAVIVIVFAFFFKHITRSLITYGIHASFYDVIRNVGLFWSNLSYISLASILRTILTSGIDSGADSMAVIITRIENGEQTYLLGKMFWLLLVAFVPRFIYPNKPDIAMGMWFTDNYWRDWIAVLKAGEGTQGTGFMLPGDFYMNFGIVGVPFGMFLVGLVIAYFTRKFFHRQVGLVGFTYIGSLYFAVVHCLYSFASYVSGFVREFLILTATMFLFAKLCRVLVIFDLRSK